MIGVVFRFGGEFVEVRIKDNNVFFRTSQHIEFGDIDGLKLNKVGVLREFPDLKDKEEWQKQAKQRFKDKIKKMKTERERANYVIEDLRKHGYEPMHEQVQGFRPKKIK